MNKIKNKKDRQTGIHSTKKLNESLALIRNKTNKPNRIILEEIICPIATALSGKKDPSGYFVFFDAENVNVKIWSASDMVMSGKLTSPLGLSDVIGVA